MADYVYAIIGIATIFLCTTIGSLVVFFIRKKQISESFASLYAVMFFRRDPSQKEYIQRIEEKMK